MTTGSGSVATELQEALLWLSARGGIVLLQKTEVHVYRGSVHRCVARSDEASSGVDAILEAIRQVRVEHERLG